MRALVSHPTWSLPVSERAAVESMASGGLSAVQFNESPEGKRRLLLFSSPEACSVHAKTAGSGEQHFLQTKGTWIFQLPLDSVDEIWIDPLNPHDIFYEKQHIPQLKAMAEAIVIEETITALRQGTAAEGAVVAIREYRSYSIAVTMVDAAPRMLFAPDNQARRLAALFTADDAFEAFVKDTQGVVQLGPNVFETETATARPDGSVVRVNHESIQQVTVPGPALFRTLGSLSLDGIVFNCRGPARPVAFAAALCQVVLDA